MSNSIHTVRWISQIANEGWEIHLFPSIDIGLTHPDLKNVIVHHSIYGKQQNANSHVHFHGLPLISQEAAFLGRKLLERINSEYRIKQLATLVNNIKPDIIHSMETQFGGYLTLDMKKRYKYKFPLWVHTVWGSDIYLFGRLEKHKGKIRDVLSGCDYLICEGERDVKLARDYGYTGEKVLVTQASSGFDISKASQIRQHGPISNRHFIMLKGYQTWAGRALVGLRALERCFESLKGYKVVIYSVSKDVEIAAKLFSNATCIPTIILPQVSYKEILGFQGRSRFSISLSISDGVPNSMLEAMVMGALPIQSWTSCADEWIEDGKNGLLVPPEDPDIVEVAIRRAVTDDDLVNRAAEENFQLCKKRLDYNVLKSKAIEFYLSVMC